MANDLTNIKKRIPTWIGEIEISSTRPNVNAERLIVKAPLRRIRIREPDFARDAPAIGGDNVGCIAINKLAAFSANTDMAFL